MLAEIFYWFLNMSISGTIVGMVIYLLSKIRQIPRNIICILWAVSFFRMWIPFGISSKFSFMTILSKLSVNVVVFYKNYFSMSMLNHVQSAEQYFPITYKSEMLENVFQIASVIWLLLAVLLGIVLTRNYIVTKRELKDAWHLQENIYISDKLSSPAVYGIFQAKILLPQVYDEADMKYILLHEKAHIRRKDNLWRIVVIMTACVHWFNPFSWLFLKMFLENMELACDEAVLKQCAEEEKKEYATTLLNCAESRNFWVSAFGGAKMKVRIGRILSYKKLSVFAGVAFVVFAVIVGYVLLTNTKIMQNNW